MISQTLVKILNIFKKLYENIGYLKKVCGQNSHHLKEINIVKIS